MTFLKKFYIFNNKQLHNISLLMSNIHIYIYAFLNFCPPKAEDILKIKKPGVYILLFFLIQGE